MRSRNLKPSFFKNEDLAELAFEYRLLFQGLWCIADREGRFVYRPKRIKAELFPYDDVDVADGLKQLSDAGFLIIYEVDGKRFVQIHSFVKHQQPHYKEVGSEIPAPPGHEDSGVVAFGVSAALRLEVFERDGQKCVTCGETKDLSLDHIVPRSRGGSNDKSNLQTLCRKCNSSKNNRIHSATSKQSQTNVGSTSVQGSRASRASCLMPHTESLMPHTANGRHEAKAAGTLKASQPRERITKRDLDNAATTDGLYQRAVSFGDISDSEINRIGFHAVAVRASSKGKDAGALFVSLVKKRAWTLPSSDGGPSEADYDKARSRLKHLLPRSQLGAVSTAANGFGLADEKGGTR